MEKTFTFDKAYYDRFYRDPDTRVASRASTGRLAAFVAHYLKHMALPVRRILDLGCGLGLWKAPMRKHFPGASYQGVEISDYLCSKHGWRKGSVVDYESSRPYDLVICQGVLQYLTSADARRAIRNLASLSRGAIYLEALTKADWRENCDQNATDGGVHLRSGSWYRRELSGYFRNCGGGLFLSHDACATLFELEYLD